MFEHPAPPSDTTRASVWTSPMALILRALPELKLDILPQWRWGAASAKPTGFLNARMPSFGPSMWRRAPEGMVYPQKESIGVDGSGTFATSHLKEYPAPLCKALAYAFGDEFEKQLRRGDGRVFAQVPVELDDWVQEMATNSASVHKEAQMRADYQGT